MTRTRRRRLLLIGCLIVGLGGAAALGLSAARQNLMYFHKPSDVVVRGVPPHTRFRMGGLVKRGTVERQADSLTIDFTVADCDASVPVQYHGTLPDLFRPGQGVVVYGKLNDHGEFIADRVLAKHDTDYMSSATADALDNKRGKSCMPASVQVSR